MHYKFRDTPFPEIESLEQERDTKKLWHPFAFFKKPTKKSAITLRI